MRTSILLAVLRGGKSELLAGPEVPLAEQQAAVRQALSGNRIDQDIAELQHWTSDGGLQRCVRFNTPKQAEAKAKQDEKDSKAHQDFLDAQSGKKPLAKKAAHPTDPKGDGKPDGDTKTDSAPGGETDPAHTETK